MVWIGIDPGSRSGAYASISDGPYGEMIEVYPWDDVFFIQHIRSLMAADNSLKACVEKVGAMPKQGVSSTWAFGKNAGFIEGVLMALGIPYQLVPPRVWKREFSLTSDKAKSIQAAHKLFPQTSLKRTGKCRVDDSNHAEALLLAEWARRKM